MNRVISLFRIRPACKPATKPRELTWLTQRSNDLSSSRRFPPSTGKSGGLQPPRPRDLDSPHEVQQLSAVRTHFVVLPFRAVRRGIRAKPFIYLVPIVTRFRPRRRPRSRTGAPVKDGGGVHDIIIDSSPAYRRSSTLEESSTSQSPP